MSRKKSSSDENVIIQPYEIEVYDKNFEKELETKLFEDTIDSLYQGQKIAFSNALIQAGKKTDIMESKIELLAVLKLGRQPMIRKKLGVNGKTSMDVHYVRISAKEVMELSGRKGGSIYTSMLKVSVDLKRKLYVYLNPNDKQFQVDNIYGAVSYDNGILDIEFNPSMEFLFYELTEKFALLDAAVSFKLRSNGGLQLYKLLKSYIFVLPAPDLSKSQEELEVRTLEMGYGKFRLELGYVDINQLEVQYEAMKSEPDADTMINAEKKAKFKRYDQFDANVIQPGIKEINEKSEIYIISIEKKTGAHNKTEGVVIKMQHNRKYYLNHPEDYESTFKKKITPLENDSTEVDIDDFIDEMRDECGLLKELKTKELKTIATDAKFDMDKIIKACDAVEAYNNNHNIDNLYAIISSAIKENWESPKKSKKKQKNQFTDFPQREYNMDEIEKNLMKKFEKEFQS